MIVLDSASIPHVRAPSDYLLCDDSTILVDQVSFHLAFRQFRSLQFLLGAHLKEHGNQVLTLTLNQELLFLPRGDHRDATSGLGSDFGFLAVVALTTALATLVVSELRDCVSLCQFLLRCAIWTNREPAGELLLNLSFIEYDAASMARRNTLTARPNTCILSALSAYGNTRGL